MNKNTISPNNRLMFDMMALERNNGMRSYVSFHITKESIYPVMRLKVIQKENGKILYEKDKNEFSYEERISIIKGLIRLRKLKELGI